MAHPNSPFGRTPSALSLIGHLRWTMQLHNGVTDREQAVLDGCFITFYFCLHYEKLQAAVVNTSLREICRIESVVIEWFKTDSCLAGYTITTMPLRSRMLGE